MMTLHKWRMAKVTAGYCVGITVAIFVLAVAYNGANGQLQILLCLAGGAGGWITGILFAPKAGDLSQFETFRNAIGAFFGGYIVSKLDGLLATTVTQQVLSDPVVVERFLLFAVSFMIGLLFTFVGRNSDVAFEPITPSQ
jgi:hypothetical protein